MTRSLYGWKPPTAATDHLKEQELRAAAERAATARDNRMQASRDWLASYHGPSRINWQGRYPAFTITQETRDDEKENSGETQAAEGGHAQSVGDAAVEGRVSIGRGVSGRPDEGSGRDVAASDAASGPDTGGSRFTREGHTDFGDGDTPF